MDKKEKLYDTWAIADKPLLDKMKRTQQLYSDVNNKDSSDENSDRDSDTNDFLALPQEFRPNLKIHSQKRTKDGNTSLNQTKKCQSIQNSASEKPANSFLEKGTFHNSTNQELSLKNKEENLFNNISSVSKTGPKNEIQYQIVKQGHFHQVAKGKMPDETLKNASKLERSLLRQKLDVVKDADSIRQQKAFLLENEDKNKKPFKYKHVQTNQLQTIYLDFDKLSFKDTDSALKEGLNYETRLAQSTYTNYKNDTHRKNRITKQNTKNRSGLWDRKFCVSSQQSIIRQDNSLKVDEHNKIEWCVIRQKTSLTVRSKITNPELNNELSSKDSRSTMKPHEKRFNTSAQKKAKNNHHTKPKAIRQFNVNKMSNNSGNFELNNNLLSNIGNNSDSTSDSDTWDSDQCINSKYQSVSGRENVKNRLRGSLSYETMTSVLNGCKTADRRKEPTLIGNKNQNGSSLLQQAPKDLKLPSHYSFQNSPWEPTLVNNIGNHSNHEQLLSAKIREQNEVSKLQQKENSLNILTCPNFTQQVNKTPNGFTLSQQAKKDLKLPSNYNSRILPREATFEISIGDQNKYEQPLPIRNRRQNEFPLLQEGESSLNMAACYNFTQRGENSDAKLTKDLEDKKESILRYGKEISDLILGSYTALNAFISFYREWAAARKELIHHFEELKQQLKESSTKSSRLKNILRLTNAGAAMAVAIPHPVASVAARVATIITSLLQTFINNQGDKSNVDNSDEMTTAVLKDNRASYDLYMYGLQCSQQFEETTKLIEEFHLNTDIQGFFDRENPEITTFIRGFLEYKPNHRIFYKKLHKCFQELLQSSKTNFSRTFCEPFTLYSLSAVDVIGHLRWRFHNEDFDGSSVRYELEEIHRFIQNSSSINSDDLQKRIQTCIGILTDELKFIESIMKDFFMFDSSLDDRTVK